MHDAVSGDIATRPKEMELGGEGLAEEDQYLLEINLEELESSTRRWEQIQQERHSNYNQNHTDIK